MDLYKRKQKNSKILANAFNLAISSSPMGISTLIVYSNKDLAIDLCKIIHKPRSGSLIFINLHRFKDAEGLRSHLYGQPFIGTNILDQLNSGTIVFENADLIPNDFQKILRAFFDTNEREKYGAKLIFLSRSLLVEEVANGHYEAPLYYRMCGTTIDCRIEEEIHEH